MERDFTRCFNGFCNGYCNVIVFSSFRPSFKVFLRIITEGEHLMKNWFIVQSHSNFENKVSGLIKEEAEKAKISDKFEEIIVPTHDVTEVKRGKRIQRKKKYFPGYVLVKCEMNNDIYHMIKNLKRVSGFLGSKGIPVPVSDKEIEKILGQIKDGVAQPKSGIEYSIGEKVQVVDGPFASFSGMVEDIDEEKSRLKVSVSIFGRPTPVDLEYNQVEKVS
jgi:transcription termination/antitermination protein NusG